MKIGLLKLYEVDDHLRGAHGDYAAMFARLLREGGLSAQWREYDVRGGEMPRTVEECDAWLISGSKHAVYENHDWLQPLFAFVREVYAADASPMAGICFGHQAIAVALGGVAEKSPRGWGAGRQTWQIAGEVNSFFLISNFYGMVATAPRRIFVAGESSRSSCFVAAECDFAGGKRVLSDCDVFGRAAIFLYAGASGVFAGVLRCDFGRATRYNAARCVAAGERKRATSERPRDLCEMAGGFFARYLTRSDIISR